MKRNTLKYALYFLAAAFLFVFFSTCEKPSEVGLEIQPPGDKLDVVYCDTISLVTYTVLEDSIRTDETSNNLLGCYIDPVFGKNTSGFYTHIRLSSNAPAFGTNPVVDSLILSLEYKSYYGDTLSPQWVKVYEIAEDFYKDSSYYSNRELSITGDVLASKTFYPLPTDDVYIGGDTLSAQLRIRLDTTFGHNILNAAAGSPQLTDNTGFLEYFKGLYVTALPIGGTGCIMSFDLLSYLSNVTLYYHNADNDSLKYIFVIDESSARFNHFNHSNYLYADPYLRSEIYGDTAKGDSLLYLQGMAGLKIRIQYPYLTDLVKNGRVAINKAELIIPVEDYNTSLEDFVPPEKLVLIEEKDGNIRFLLDQYEGAAYYGGTYDATNKQYKFNIARHVQQVIDGIKENIGLSLVVYTADRPNKANRVVIKGSKRTENLRLLVTYTKLY
ncbi:MAG: DUF4270 domain-containing protein [Bacteroidota bacterium]